MKLILVLGEAGNSPGGPYHYFWKWGILESYLVVKANVPGIEKQRYEECIKDAEINCPISKQLNTSISVEASLEKATRKCFVTEWLDNLALNNWRGSGVLIFNPYNLYFFQVQVVTKPFSCPRGKSFY